MLKEGLLWHDDDILGLRVELLGYLGLVRNLRLLKVTANFTVAFKILEQAPADLLLIQI